jgi:tRNA dimethylallyltransferase
MPTSIKKPRVIVICGPTGVGKTSLSLNLADTFNGEIIGADSMQLYRYMDIGTAKPTAEEMARIQHHMVSIADPDEPFDAHKYSLMARRIINECHGRKKLPLIVGGTGLYIKALLYGIFESPPVDPDIRQKLKAEAQKHGGHYLYRRLQACDPVAAHQIHPSDNYRLIRALEVFESTGQSIVQHRRAHQLTDTPFDALKIGLALPRQTLYHRINMRVDQMIAEGFLEEVKSLIAKGYEPTLKSMGALGYRHLAAYLQGCLKWEEALRTLKRDTRRYAKRQLTWFRTDPLINWFEPRQFMNIFDQLSSFLK